MERGPEEEAPLQDCAGSRHVIDVEHNRSLMGESLEAKMARLDDFKPADKRARRSVLRANKGIKFRASHPLSHLLVNNGRVELGTRAAGYFKLLTMPVDSLTEIYAAWVVKGDT